MKKQISDKKLIYLLTFFNFLNILDFMTVAPLGLEFSENLGIPIDKIGIISGSYTFAASMAAIVSSFFLDRFDRRKVLLVCVWGLTLATLLCGFAFDFLSLVITRCLAGAFGGPATAVAISILSDRIPPQRRGEAMGIFMSGFALASFLGIPLSIELAQRLQWRAPFFFVAALTFLTSLYAFVTLPKMVDHLKGVLEKPGLFTNFFLLVKNKNVLLGFVSMFCLMMGAFSLIPNIANYVQSNLEYPRSQLSLMYCLGGVASFVSSRIFGKIIDRFGATPVLFSITIFYCCCVALIFISAVPWIPVILITTLFMVSNSGRIIGTSTVLTKIPSPSVRAQFQSLLACVQHFAMASGAVIGSTLFLSVHSDGTLIGMDNLALFSIIVSLVVPFVVYRIETRMRERAV